MKVAVWPIPRDACNVRPRTAARPVRRCLHGAYVADVKLRITDASGKGVSALKDAGPLTDVKLPAGHYHVAGQFDGVKQGASVDVKPGQPASLTLHWRKDAA